MTTENKSHSRIRIIGFVFILLIGVVLLRLVQIQLVQHDYFSVLASESHNRKFEIAPQRGQIFMYDRGEPTPVALNRSQKTLYADTRYIFDEDRVVVALESITGTDYREKISSGEGYVLLEDEIPFDIAEEIESLEVSGIGLSDGYRRVYPEGELGAQVLGFVNSDGAGQYGIEGYLDSVLSGTPGMFDIETDASGIPIATGDNIQVQPVDGSDVFLTIDRNLQAHVEQVLAQGVDDANARSAHALVMDMQTGRVVAMANYPGYDPNEYREVDDYRRFINVTTSELFEPGSGFKVFTMAAGLESGAIAADETYFDEGSAEISGHTIENVQSERNLERRVAQVLINSVNTGALHILQQMGDGDINTEARRQLHHFFSERFRLAEPTGIQQPGEPGLSINEPEESPAINYANMTFGQGISTSMMRMVTSMAAIINDGTMYAPSLVDYEIASDGSVNEYQPEIVAEGVVSSDTSREVREMMQESVDISGGGYAVDQRLPDHALGGKTGTAEIPDAEGGYQDGSYIGSFVGFAPGDNPKYIAMVRIDEPDSSFGFAGSGVAGPIFGDIMEWLVKYDGIPPQTE